MIHIELIPEWYRRRAREAYRDLDRPKLGESSDERAARDALRPKTGAVAPSVRRIAAFDTQIAQEQERDRVLGRRR